VYSSLKQPEQIGRSVSLTVVKLTLTAKCSVLVLAPSPLPVPRDALTKTMNVKDNVLRGRERTSDSIKALLLSVLSFVLRMRWA
jgi:hypothetical protein